MFGFKWPRRKKIAEQVEQASLGETARRGFWSTDPVRLGGKAPVKIDFQMPNGVAGMTMDAAIGSVDVGRGMVQGMPEALLDWYASQTFIGYQACALIAQHWMVMKCCRMPARDAIRQGYTLDTGNDKLSETIRKSDARYALNTNLADLITFGRQYGVRYVLFDVLSVDPEYYVKPFNLDGVLPGCYRGMKQIDPQWVTPQLTGSNIFDPAHPCFMKPEFFNIGGKTYHRSHLHIFIPVPVSDQLKPMYKYGGLSIPQMIHERVYAAERTANEAPQLAMTKRLTTFQAGNGADLASVLSNMANFAEVRNNYGVMVHGEGESVGQFDTTLADFDALCMTQYQLVASGANVPATKLLGTTPKGFNATGEYEEASYREELESVQTNDLAPLLERHYKLQCRSQRIDLPEGLSIQWQPLDSPTATEWAALNKTKAETDKIYYDMQAIDGEDVLNRLRNDREGDYFGIAENADLEPEPAEEAVPVEADPNVEAPTPVG